MPITLDAPPVPTAAPSNAQPILGPTPEPVPAPRLLTAADLAAMPDELPSGAVKMELDDGRLVIMPPPGDIHGRNQGRVYSELLEQGERRGHGEARSEVGVILRRNPDRVVGPDASFIANRSLPVRRSPEGYLETIPELVVEVRSKNETVAALERKAGEYLAAGSLVVWVVDPIRRLVTVYRGGSPPQVLQPTDTVTAEGIIPDFRLTVADILRS